MKSHILIVEDEYAAQEMLECHLSNEGYEVAVCSRGDEALKQVFRRHPSLILLNWTLPGQNGLEVCKSLKSNISTSSIPIIMLTARVTEADTVEALLSGADDFVTKPFSLRELSARIIAVLRRSGCPTILDKKRLQFDQMTIDLAGHAVSVNGRQIPLTLTEYCILKVLAENVNIALTRRQIVSLLARNKLTATESTIDVHIVALRRKIPNAGLQIETIRGIGYKFIAR